MSNNQDAEIETHKTPIQKFYAKQSIFITGGTGFLGKILIEKLLRSCPDISTIYILIRMKKNKNSKVRLDEMFENQLYDRIRKEIPQFRDKVVPVIGDLNSEDLNLSEDDKNLLIHEVSVIFHMAATVRFNEKAKIATLINVSATNAILNIAKSMSRLKAFIYVSTAFSNCYINHIKECFYSYPIDHKDLIMLTRHLPDEIAEEVITRIFSQWPNTYTFTKAIAETLVRDEGKDLPIGIFRPAIVISAAREPIGGWVDNLYGPMGFTVSSTFGLLRFLHCKRPDNVIDIVPVDFTINALIVSAWDVYNHPCKRGNNMLIYNFTSSVDAPYTIKQFVNDVSTYMYANPTRSIWYPSLTLVRRKTLYVIIVWFCHLLPSFLVDTTRICMGLRPSMRALYKKIDMFIDANSYFYNKEWNFSTYNVQTMWERTDNSDKKLFQFSMKGFDWYDYIPVYCEGIARYLLKDDRSTLEANRAKYRRLYFMHQALKVVIMFMVGWIIWSIL